MKKSVLGLVGFSMLVAAPAMAADLRMPVKAPPMPVATEFTWTGWYAGINVGGSWADDPELFSIFPFPGFGGLTVANTAHSSSIVGGGQIGYNYQINHIVLGLEADLDGRNNSNNFSCSVNATVTTTGCSPASVSVLTMHAEQNWLGTVRGRLGLAFDRFFLYGTGGLAYGNVQHTLNETQLNAVGGTPTGALIVSDNTTKTGWAAGVGGEYAINNQWSVGVEWLHVDLGTDTLLTPNPGVTVGGTFFNPSGATFRDRSDIVRARLDYRFNLGGPVATRY